MTYWNEINDSHIRFWDTDIYPSYYKIKHEINENGYRGDRTQPSEVLYLGTCDVMSNLPPGDGQYRWSALVHTALHPDQPYIALGTVASGLPSMVRRLYAYIQNFGAPKYLYMTVPRFDGYEYVNKSGKCYNVSSRVGSAKFCRRCDFIDEDELNVWLMQLESNKRLNNIHNMQYMIEERFAFIETLCKAHNIELKWTFNPSDAAIVVLYKNLPAIKDISKFMKDSFVGLPIAKDHVFDRSIDWRTHREVCDKFLNRETWDYDVLCSKAETNYKWLEEKYVTDLIKTET